MGTALTVAASLALLLALLLLLLADLLCSLLCCRNRPECDATTTGMTTPDRATSSGTKRETPSSFSTLPFCAHGVLQAPPPSFLLTIPKIEAAAGAWPTPPPPPLGPADSHFSTGPSSRNSCSTDHFIYISNPIFDGANATGGARDSSSGSPTTPFETPGTSPSYLGFEDCSPPLAAMRKNSSSAGLMSDGEWSAATSMSAIANYSLCSSPSW